MMPIRLYSLRRISSLLLGDCKTNYILVPRIFRYFLAEFGADYRNYVRVSTSSAISEEALEIAIGHLSKDQLCVVTLIESVAHR